MTINKTFKTIDEMVQDVKETFSDPHVEGNVIKAIDDLTYNLGLVELGKYEVTIEIVKVSDGYRYGEHSDKPIE